MPQSLISEALKKLPAKAPESQKALVKKLGHSISSEDVELFNIDLFLDMVQSHWSLSKTRKSGTPKISVHCPLTTQRKLRKTIVDVVSDDMAFLVDSVVAEVNRHNLLIDFLIHPVFYVKYNKNNAITGISETAEKGYKQQSHIHIHIRDTVSEKTLVEMEKGLQEALKDVRLANRDWKPILHALKEAREELANSKTPHPKKQIEEYCAFLDYLHDNNFTLLGYRAYDFIDDKDGVKSKTRKSESLGLLSDEVKPAYISENKEGLPRNLQELRRNLPPVSVSKTNRLSTVHRRVPMDAIAIKIYDDEGRVIGEKLFLGLFTSVTYSRSVSDVPYLREKVDKVMEMSGFAAQSHDYKALRHTLEKYPRDELFQIAEKELLSICLDILRLQERQRIALFMRRDPFGRYISCLVYVPRDRFGTALRQEIGAILEDKLNGQISDFYTSLDDSLFARVMFIINVSQKNPPRYNPAELEKLVRQAGQTWSERLSVALSETTEDNEDITRLTLKYGDAFPMSYTAKYSAKEALFDIKKIEAALEIKHLQLDLYKPDTLQPNQIKLKFYSYNKPLILSDVLPIMEHMGMRAVTELPFEVVPNGGDEKIWIHDFLLEMHEVETAINIAEIKENFETALIKIWYRDVESDSLNRLILSTNMSWAETRILRTYVRFLKQINYPFGRLYVEKALTQNADISRLLVNLFKIVHNPEKPKKLKNELEKAENKIRAALDAVQSLDQDRILRNIYALIKATLRTNYFQPDENGEAKTYLSVKLDSQKISNIPEPRPFREIFVYSPRMEGIHLRGDKIARGGIRWSDRHEDYRTEVLGLMKAQMVKNAVIVPMGAKGGFVVKADLRNRDAFHEEGVECYKIFIRGLLDITDNRDGKDIVPPKNVVRLDGDDPYFVVAADKGTATFSDIANSIAREYDFWLGDGFASGGSAGYDHKKMGITARGAWESVKLHFRHLNHNTQTQPFDVIGVGDMSGDVFGNGMLLSDKIRLIGAFNHLHIFCDPDPDPAKSFKERKRLFKNVQGWDHYDEKKLSKGGRIYERSTKSLKLTPEIQARFEIEDDTVSPAELIQAMLRARTDLLWFGGIGTYIKSSKETHGEVGDKANDALRIDGKDVQAKVIGEGANLGVTQRGRVEYESNGGRINTDFIDNSGGVDTSDHEVNIKILLADVMRQKKHKMNMDDRNALLSEMTGEIAAHVLRDNYQQAQAISLAEYQAPDNIQDHEDFIENLERHKGLNRNLEGLPDTETTEKRAQIGRGLTRPELCVLLSHAKIGFTQDLLASEVPDNPKMATWLIDYFPEALQEKYKKEIKRHRLSREIIAMAMANSFVNRMGPVFIQKCEKRTGASCADIASAYIIVREVFDLRGIWNTIEKLDNEVPAELQLKAMKRVQDLAEHAIIWFLTGLGRDPDIVHDSKTYGEGVRVLHKNITKLPTKSLKTSIKQTAQALRHDGLPNKLAKEIAAIPVLISACDIIRIAGEQGADLMVTAKTYFEIGERFHLSWLRNQAQYLSTEDPWQAKATEGLVDQLFRCQAGLVTRILRDLEWQKDTHGTKGGLFAEWVEKHGAQVRNLDPIFAELRRAGTIDLSMLIIAEQRLRALYGG